MKPSQASRLLCSYRPNGPADTRHGRALKAIDGEPAMRKLLDEQIAFDQQMCDIVRALRPPADLRQRVEQHAFADAGRPKGSRRFAVLSVIAIVMGMAIIAGLFINMEMERRKNFPGRERVLRLLSDMNEMSGIELQPVQSSLAALQDRMYMRGFDNFILPPELEQLPAVGWRVKPAASGALAQVAIDRENSILYVFRASDYGVVLPPNSGWHTFEHDGWAAALKEQGGVCSMLSLRGEKEAMDGLISSLEKEKK